MSDDIVQNLTRPSIWLRILFMIGFAVALYVTAIILLVLVGAQILFSLFSGGDNINLRRFGAALTEYIRQILLYLTFNSESRPFPFAPFPLLEISDKEPPLPPDPVVPPPGEPTIVPEPVRAASTSQNLPGEPTLPVADDEQALQDEKVVDDYSEHENITPKPENPTGV